MSRAQAYRSMNDVLSDADYWLSVGDAVLVPLMNGKEYETGQVAVSIQTIDLGIDASSWETVGTDFFNCGQELDHNALQSWLTERISKACGDDYHTGRVKMVFKHKPSGDHIASKSFTIKSRIADNEREASRFQAMQEQHLKQLAGIAGAFPDLLRACASMMKESAQMQRAYAELVRAGHEQGEGQPEGDESTAGSMLKLLGTLMQAIDSDTSERLHDAGDVANTVQSAAEARETKSLDEESDEEAEPVGPRFTIRNEDGTLREATVRETIEAGYNPYDGEKLTDEEKAEMLESLDEDEQMDADTEGDEEESIDEYLAKLEAFTKKHPLKVKAAAKRLIEKDLIPGVAPTVATIM
jgi:hypothetical protein